MRDVTKHVNAPCRCVLQKPRLLSLEEIIQWQETRASKPFGHSVCLTEGAREIRSPDDLVRADAWGPAYKLVHDRTGRFWTFMSVTTSGFQSHDEGVKFLAWLDMMVVDARTVAQKGGRGMGLRDRYDVIIVGSGPAGAGAAKALSGTGLETLIVERTRLPRYKMCSGILFPSSRKFVADNFGELPAELLCSPERIKGNRVFATIDSPAMDVPFSVFDEGEGLEEEGFNTWRSDLDFWLCSHTDADLVDTCRFDDFDTEGQEYVVKLRHLGQEVSVRTRYLIGTDGTLSRVRRMAFPGFEGHVGLVPNYEEIYTGEIDLEPGWLYLFMDRSITGYFATVFHKDGTIVVVTGVQQRESVKDYFAAFRSHLERDHGLVVKSEASRHGIVLTDMSARKNYCLGTGALLLAGEAGGFLRGGEGITSSLVSGKAAGEAVVESEKSGRPAIDHFRDLASKEMETCNRVHASLSEALGFNVFMRE